MPAHFADEEDMPSSPMRKISTFSQRSRKPSTVYGPVDEYPNFLPKGQINTIICFFVFAISLYSTILAIVDRNFFDPLPAKNLTSQSINATGISIETDYPGACVTLCTLLLCALAAGCLLEKLTLPGLLGMLIAGIALRNIPLLSALYVPKDWSIVLRKVAFIVILLRGGLSLDAGALARMKGACLRLALLPCTVEAITVAVTAKLLFGLSIWFGLTLGFILAAVSPAVVVPSMLDAAAQGYGQRKGIPTLVIAASSLDDVYAITLFSMCCTVTFATGDSILMTVVKVPFEILAGVALGVTVGGFLRYFPHPDGKDRNIIRFSLLCVLSTSLFFGCARIGMDAAGPIAVLVAAFVAANEWQKEGVVNEQQVLSSVWTFVFQPLLFVLIGFELSFSMLSWSTGLLGLIVLCVGLTFRTLTAFSAVFRATLNYKEQLFVAFAWMPKATVQAALAPVALDLALAAPLKDEEMIRSSTIVFAISVMSILTTAPVGAFLIRFLAPRLLRRDPIESELTQEPSIIRRSSGRVTLNKISVKSSETTMTLETVIE